MLPEAEIAFLDEVFLGSTAILNTLLGVLNERTFRRGQHRPDRPAAGLRRRREHAARGPALAAFADRFLARLFVEPGRRTRAWKNSSRPAGDRLPSPRRRPTCCGSVDRLAVAARAPT